MKPHSPRFTLGHLFSLTCFIAVLSAYFANPESDWASNLTLVVGLLLGAWYGRTRATRQILGAGIGGALTGAIVSPAAAYQALVERKLDISHLQITQVLIYFLLSFVVLAGAGFVIGVVFGVVLIPLRFVWGKYVAIADELKRPMARRDQPPHSERVSND